MRFATTVTVLLLVGVSLAAQERPLPPPPRVPVLRIDHGGPQAPVTAVAFAPDGTLFVGGLEKQVRRYRSADGRWTEDAPLRVPTGPGNSGAVNAVAVSPDGKLVAVAGRSPMRDESNLAEAAIVVDPKLLPGPMRRDLGVIYLMDPGNPNVGRVLRGHLGPVLALAFADPSPKTGRVIVSAAVEPDPNDASKSVGVVRAWDANTGRLIGTRSGFPATQTRPGLAAWSDAKGTLQVAIAWPGVDPKAGGQIVVWKPQSDTASSLDDAALNFALTTRTRNGSTDIVGGGFANFGKPGPQYGRLAVRNAADPATQRDIPFPPVAGTYFLPLAITTVGADLAVLLETTPPAAGRTDRPAELRVLTMDGQLRGQVTISGLSRGMLPTLAATDGTIAVGGFSDNRVELFDPARIAAGAAKPTIIPGASAGFAGIAFLADRKLWLGGPDDSPAQGGMVFDFAGRKARPNAGKSAVDAVKSVGRVTLVTDQRPAAVRVRFEQRETIIPLRNAEVPTAAVLIPAENAGVRSVVAVAHTDPVNRVTLISVFDDKTGQRLRQLIGPEQPIRSLAVSGTLPLLAAVGDDRLVTVWSLKPFGRSTGAIEGLNVTGRDGEVVVAGLTDAAEEATRMGLQPEDVLTAVGDVKGQPEAVATPAEFLFAVRARPVGDDVAVTVKGKPAPIVLPVGRAVEQQGPLFSLWVDSQAGEGERAWVGWNPNGPYDASSPKAEARIGWLSNTGDPTHPVSYAGADQYRQEYFKRDLLRFLADKGDLSSAVGAWWDEYPPAQLKVQLLVPGTVVGPGGRDLLRSAAGELRVMVQGVGNSFPLDQAVVRLRATRPGADPVDLPAVPLADGTLRFSVDLTKHDWTRGEHRFEAQLHRSPGSPAVAANATDVLYLPQAPKLAVMIDGRPANETPVATMKPTVEIAGTVAPKDGIETDVTVTVTDPTGEARTVPLSDSTTMKLKPGRTRLLVRAVNRGAGDFSDYESDEQSLSVDYTPPEVILPPTIDRFGLVPVAERVIVGDQPVSVIAEPEVTVSTRITAEKPLIAVDWDNGDGKWRSLPLGEKARKSFDFRQTVALEPGATQHIRVRASVAKADPTVATVAAVYHPPLPTITVDPIPDGATTSPALIARGTFDKATVRGKFRVQLVSAAGATVKIVDAVPDVAAGTWLAAVGLDPGVNSVGLVVSNEWREDVRSNLASVTYRRPARVVAVSPVDAGDGAVADVSVTAITDDTPGLAPTAVVVDGMAVPTPRPATKVFDFLGTAWWQLTAPAVPVKSGDRWRDTIAVAVRNVDGDGTDISVPVKRKPKPTRPPVIALADGTHDRTTDRPALPVAFKISSDTPLSRTTLWVVAPGGPPAIVAEFDPGTAVAGDNGFVLTGNATVELRAGVNRVRLTAVNAGGESSAEFAVGYTVPALRIVIDTVEELGPGATGEALARVPTDDGRDRYQTATSGFVAVRGRVLWSTDEIPFARSPGLNAVLAVNQVSHLPVQVDLPTGRAQERSFVAPLFLNDSDAEVTVGLRAPGRTGAMPQERLGSVGFRVACAEPITSQRLHVVVVGVDAPRGDRFDLVKDVVLALGGAEPGPGFDNGEFRHPAFERAIVYPPVVGEVDDGRVAWALDEVDRRLKRDGSGKPGTWLNDVVLLYYQGQDWIGADGRHWLHTSRSMKYPKAAAGRFAVDVGGLPDTPGVRLVLLNVIDPNSSDGSVSEEHGPTGPPLLRYVWKENGASRKLLDYLALATSVEATLSGVMNDLRDRAGQDPARAVDPFHRLPDQLGQRPFGQGSGRPD